MQNNIFEVSFWPQFRDTDADGVIGLRGMMNYFQDITSHQMYDLKYGNHALKSTYNKVWFITKYKLKINKRIDFSESKLILKSWIEEKSSPALMYQGFSIERNNEIFAYGRLELCLIDLTSRKLSKISSINLPKEYTSSMKLEDVIFEKIRYDLEEKEYCYSHKVRFNDIDETNHMNNLAYVSMLTNTFSTEFLQKNEICDFTINYLEQCFEGEEIKVYRLCKEDKIFLHGEKEDGKIAVKAVITIKNIG